MTNDKLKAIMAKHDLGLEDISAVTGKTTRQVHSWLNGLYPVPRMLALLLFALDEGKISAADLVRWVRREASAAAKAA